MLQCRTESADDLVELRLFVCVHCAEWCSSGPQTNTQRRVSCAIQISSTCFPPHHLQVVGDEPKSHTFVAFVEIRVEDTLIRLHFLRDTQSRLGASLSAPWSDTGIAQGQVLSPFSLILSWTILQLTFVN